MFKVGQKVTWNDRFKGSIVVLNGDWISVKCESSSSGEFTIGRIYCVSSDYLKIEEENCICEIGVLMTCGCKCGWIEKEREGKTEKKQVSFSYTITYT